MVSVRFQTPYWVVSTDYDNYAFVYGCQDPVAKATCEKPDGWVWSRTKTLSKEQWKVIYDLLPSLCLEKKDLVDTPQTKGMGLIYL